MRSSESFWDCSLTRIVISRTKERQSPSVSVRFMEEKMDSLEVNQSNRVER